MMKILILLVPLLAQVFANTEPGAPEWNYDTTDTLHGPDSWKDHYPTCGKEIQSPIDITTPATRQNKNLVDFQFIGYSTVPSTLTLVNNGHSVQVNMPDNSVKMGGGDLFATFTLSQFHFHWGADDSTGSEHTINGKAYPLEIHLVHWNSDTYSSFDEASSKSDGIAVLAILVDVGVAGEVPLNDNLGQLTQDFTKVLHYQESTTTKPFPIMSLVPTNHTYYRYHGSLTTPGCAQSVTWTVFQQPIYISEEQMVQFREIHSEFNDELLEHNYRPTQPLNGRLVFSSPVILARK
jgi:carbonic anhydrase